MKLLFITLLISGIAFGQKKLPNSSQDSSMAATSNTGQPMTIKADSVTSTMNEFLFFLQDKVTVKEYIPIQAAVNAFIQYKEYLKPKKK